MKKSCLLLTLSACLILAGCGDKVDSDSSLSFSESSQSSQSTGQASSSESVSSSKSEKLSEESSSSESESSSESSSSSSTSEVTTVTIAKLKELLATATTKSSLISSGTVKNSSVDSWSSSEYQTTFEFGSNNYGEAIHYKENEYGEEKDIYVFKDSATTIGKISENSKGEYKSYSDSIPTVGYSFELESLLGESSAIYGIEQFGSKILEYAEKNVNQDFKASYSNGTYTLSFGYLTGLSATSVTVNEMSFTLGSDNEISSLNVTSKEYSSGYVIDDETTTFMLSGSASPSATYKYETTQIKGTRSYVLPFNIDELYLSSFDLLCDGEVIGDALTLNKGKSYSWTIANILPTTADVSIDSFSVKEVGNTDSKVELSVSTYGSFKVNVFTYEAIAGTYNFVFSSKKVTKNIAITIKVPDVEYISGVTYLQEWETGNTDYSSDNIKESKSTFLNSPLYLIPNISPTAADQEVTSSLTETSGATLTKQELDLYGEGETKTYYTFVGTQVGTYHITFTSVSNPSISKSIQIVVEEKPSFAELLSKTYVKKKSGYGWEYKFSFTPDSEDDMKGTATISSKNRSGDYTYAITKNEEGGTYTLAFTLVSGNSVLNCKLILGKDYSLQLYEKKNEYSSGALDEYTYMYDIAGEYDGADATNAYNATFVLQSGGTATISVHDDTWDYYEYVEADVSITQNEDGTYTGTATTLEKDPFTPFPLSFTIQKVTNANGKSVLTLSVNLTIKEIPYTFNLELS